MTLNTIPSEDRSESIEAIQPLLAGSLYLARVAKHAHWNVTGANFIGVHRLLDEVYEAAEDWADSIAERIRGLGGTAKGSPSDVVDGSPIKFAEIGVDDQKVYIDVVARGLGALSKLYRDQVAPLNSEDPGTSNMLQDLTLKADHFVYLLESHL